jgi:hypothetical protein
MRNETIVNPYEPLEPAGVFGQANRKHASRVTNKL